MEVIYIDSLFALNLLADYIICLASGRICGLYLKRGRYFFAALLGALYSVAVYLPGLEILSLPAAKFSAGLLMGMLAFGTEQRPLRCTAVFMAVSAAFGGGVWALSMWGGNGPVRLSMKTLVMSFALCYAAASLIFRKAARLPDKQRVPVRLQFMDRECRFMALVDTGNRLSDPGTGKDVMVACPHALKPLFPDNAGLLHADPVEMLELSSLSPELKGRFRLIPYSALGTHALLPVFRADKVFVDGIERPELLTAISPDAKGDGFEALI